MIRLKAFQRLLIIFNGDFLKANQWLDTSNEAIDGLKPKQLSQLGKHDQLDNLIDDLIRSN